MHVRPPTEPVLPRPDNQPLTNRDQLQLTSSFPTSDLLIRTPGGAASSIRAIYLTNPTLRQVVQNNDYTRLRLLTAGTKLFVKQGDEGRYRVLNEGLPAVMPYVKPETVLEADLASLRVLMRDYYPLCATLPRGFREKIQEEREWIFYKWMVQDIDDGHVFFTSEWELYRPIPAGTAGWCNVRPIPV